MRKAEQSDGRSERSVGGDEPPGEDWPAGQADGSQGEARPWHPGSVPDPAPEAHAIEKADVAVTQAVAPLRRNRVVRALGVVGELGDQPPLVALTSAAVMLGWASGNRRLAVAGGRMLGSHLLATAIKAVIKARVDRTRPSLLVDERRYVMRAGSRNEGAWNSFPSGHTAGAVAVARALARDYPQHGGKAGALAALIALIQIPRCAHYPSDIGAGALVGLAAEAAVSGPGARLLHRAMASAQAG